MEQQIKFDKSFEALYKSAMGMADAVIVKKDIKDRFLKLFEEYNELIQAQLLFEAIPTHKRNWSVPYHEKLNHLKCEFGDVLFVLLHIAHQYNFTPFDLLHGAMTKMLARMNDVNYIAKN